MSSELFFQAASSQNWGDLIQLIPYTAHLGIAYNAEQQIFQLPFQERFIGNQYIRAMHGGVLASFMENAALIHCAVEQKQPRIPKPINFQIDYLRSAQAQDCYVRCETTRLGKRVANISVKCWQLHEHKPVAVARSHMLLD